MCTKYFSNTHFKIKFVSHVVDVSSVPTADQIASSIPFEFIIVGLS